MYGGMYGEVKRRRMDFHATTICGQRQGARTRVSAFRAAACYALSSVIMITRHLKPIAYAY